MIEWQGPCSGRPSHTPARSPLRAGAGELAFCSGGDQSVRGQGGYVGSDGVPRLNVLDLQARRAPLLLLRQPPGALSPRRLRSLGSE